MISNRFSSLFPLKRHEFTSSFASEFDKAAASMPRTILRRKDCEVDGSGSCDLREFSSGEQISLAVSDLLVLLEVELDSNACDQRYGKEENRSPGGNKECPMTRVSGLHLDVEMA